MEGIKVIIVGVCFFAYTGVQLTRHFQLEKWLLSLGLFGLGICLYLLNVGLVQHYITKRVTDFASNEETLPGVQKWEL